MQGKYWQFFIASGERRSEAELVTNAVAAAAGEPSTYPLPGTTVNIPVTDLRIDSWTRGLRSSGYRIVHFPTGLVAEGETENKALNLLSCRLYMLMQDGGWSPN